MKNEIRKVLAGISVAIVALVIVDWCVGTWNERMYYKAQYGILHRQTYCLKSSEDKVLILGSSRAAHHYVPQIIEDSLGISCYNVGSDGMCIYYHYAVLASYIHRGAIPKVVILEVMPSDVSVSGGDVFSLEAAMDRLAPHYGEVPAIDSLFLLKGWKERLKLCSKTYRYNSKLVQAIKCNYIPWPEDRGYEALNGVLDSVLFEKEAHKRARQHSYEIEPMKIEYLKKTITLCKQNGIELFMAWSPYYKYREDVERVNMIRDLALQQGVQFLDYHDDPQFQYARYFQDAGHLNDTGAKRYTEKVVSKLK